MLNGIRVLDVGGWGVGPIACCLLGSLGADVIRFEPPKYDGLYHVGTMLSGAGTTYISAHFNERNIIIDLKKEDERELGLKIAATADVLIENHPPGAMAKLQFDYESVRKVNPNIIYCASSSYGTKGPYANMPSNDPMMQLASGFASLNGSPGSQGEMFRYVASVDYTTSLNIVQVVLLALMARQVTGRGQKIEMSQFEAVLALQTTRIAEFFATGKSPSPMGTANPNIVPSQAFRTYDNKYVNVSVHREEYWPRLCKALGLADLEKDPKYATNEDRVKNREELIPILEEKFAREPARWWLMLMRRSGVPIGPINSVDEIYNDPHLRENKMILKLKTPWGPTLFTNFPLKFSNPLKPIKITAPVKPDKNRREILVEVSGSNKQTKGKQVK
ncbi:MAG: CoA transferase [Dehalococcoidia bacterium]|jgi:crotonobetainyl-CoA:carnitine CoA-transferase CaiB-like acyl-CoA transferase